MSAVHSHTFPTIWEEEENKNKTAINPQSVSRTVLTLCSPRAFCGPSAFTGEVHRKPSSPVLFQGKTPCQMLARWRRLVSLPVSSAFPHGYARLALPPRAAYSLQLQCVLSD